MHLDMKNIYVALDNVRSLENVGAIMRTCSFFGFTKLVLIGYSGSTYDFKGNKIVHPMVSKTALGAEKDVEVTFCETYEDFFDFVSKEGLVVVSVEQGEASVLLNDINAKDFVNDKLVLVFGNEKDGVNTEILEKSMKVVEIAKLGSKHSLNVASTVGIVLFKISSFFIKKVF